MDIETNINNMQSIIKNKDHSKKPDRWFPTSIDNLENAMNHGKLEFENYTRTYRDIEDGSDEYFKLNSSKNAAYALQYLEYIQLQLDSLNLTTVIEKSLYKTYLLFASAIIEVIFYYILKRKNLNWKTEWKTEVYYPPLYETIVNIRYKKKKERQIKLDAPVDSPMSFDNMIDELQENNVLDLSEDEYIYLTRLRQLRNRVHLQANTEGIVTDYYAFDKKEYLLARYMLYRCLCEATRKDEPLENEPECMSCFDFIRIDDDDENDSDRKRLQKYFDEIIEDNQEENPS